MKTYGLITGAAILLVSACAPQNAPVAAEHPSLVQVGPNVNISASRSNQQHWENMIAVNPRDSQDLVACTMVASPHRTDDYFQNGQTNYATAAYTSHDGGKSWNQTILRTGTWDPSCEFSPDGTAYFVEMGPEMKDAVVRPASEGGSYHLSRVFIFRSKDGGTTWSAPTKVFAEDRDFITLPQNAGKCDGAVVISAIHQDPMSQQNAANGSAFARMYPASSDFFFSSDGGRTFTKTYFYGIKHQAINNMSGVMLSDGTVVHGIYPVSGKTLKAAVFSGCGRTFAGDYAIGTIKSLPEGAGVGNAGEIAMAADSTARSPFANRVYATWVDKQDKRLAVYEAFSADKGRTWSTPVLVDEQDAPGGALGPASWLAEPAVNKDGVLGITWYSRIGDGWNVHFAASIDGGETFLPSVNASSETSTYNYNGTGTAKISAMSGSPTLLMGSVPKNLSNSSGVSLGYNARYDFDNGDTSGLAADSSGTFHASWIDTRTGLAQLFTAPIHVNAVAAREGSAALARRKDVSQDVRLLMGDAVLDRATHEITANAWLRNSSKHAVAGPFTVRVILMRSGMGVPVFLNPDNGLTGRGAVFNFSQEVLASGALSTPKTLHFRVDDFHDNALTNRQSNWWNFVTLGARVYGR